MNLTPVFKPIKKNQQRDKPSNKDGNSRGNKCNFMSSGGSLGDDKENHGSLGIVDLKLIY
jgi:hypothetical protein